MEVKVFEIRDIGTFLPVICIRMATDNDREGYLLKRLGYMPDSNLIQLVWTTTGRTEYDPYKWADRTLFTAHKYIAEEWENLKSGVVIDVEYVLKEKDTPKKSERYAR